MTNFVSTHWGTYATSKNNQNNIKINNLKKNFDNNFFYVSLFKNYFPNKIINKIYII